MGRPINKRHFTTATVGATASGNEIKVNFHNGSAVKEGTIVKQKGSKRFVVEEIGTAGTFTCTLTNGKKFFKIKRKLYIYSSVIDSSNGC